MQDTCKWCCARGLRARKRPTFVVSGLRESLFNVDKGVTLSRFEDDSVIGCVLDVMGHGQLHE